MARQRVVEGDDSAVREKRPKSSNSIRSIMLDKETAAMLGRLRRVGGSAYMFTGRTNLPLRPDNITDRFNKLAAAGGVRQIGPHQIRHMLVIAPSPEQNTGLPCGECPSPSPVPAPGRAACGALHAR
ncbi:hypothetical protein CS0771_47320 [Catellatospora sp. IY07-71]|nr:hypothetical protein CS0771_47320 [Catellatospora sp. IY07-71]